MVNEFFKVAHDLTKNLINDFEVQKLLRSDAEFDLVLAESCLNDAVLGETLILTAKSSFSMLKIHFRVFGTFSMSTHCDIIIF